MKKLLSYFFAVALMISAFSCSDDEDVCDGNEKKLMAYEEEYYEAVDAQDCAEIEAMSEKLVSLARKSKSCDFVKDFLNEGDYSDLEEYLAEWEAEVATDLADAGCL